MKVRELIDKLSKLDPDMTVVVEDSEDGTQGIDEPYEMEAYWEYPDKAKVICLPGSYNFTVDEQYIIKGEKVEYVPTPRTDAILSIYREQLRQQLIHPTFYRGNPAPENGSVTFKIVKDEE